MKFQFKFKFILIWAVISLPAYSRDIILVENQASSSEGQMLLSIIQQKFKIPRKLITYRNVKNDCQKTSEAIMQLCLQSNGELTIVKINKMVVENSLRAFQEVENL